MNKRVWYEVRQVLSNGVVKRLHFKYDSLYVADCYVRRVERYKKIVFSKNQRTKTEELFVFKMRDLYIEGELKIFVCSEKEII